MSDSSKQTASHSGTILLVEEYQALAVAFGTALKKFARKYDTRVVPSLVEAEKAIDETHPDLLVLDFDPPPQGSVAFLKRLKAFLPEARVLIVTAWKAPDFSADRSTPAALHFIEKPFELEKFGAAVAELLPETAAAGLGTLRDLDLIDMIILYAVSGATITLKVEAGSARNGEIHFFDGRISHAAVMGQAGMPALQTILRWRSPRFSEAERPSTIQATIHGGWAQVLRDSLQAIHAAPASVLQRASQVSTSAMAGAKKIVVVDDTELLSIFVEEVLVASDPALEITSAHAGLEGLERIASQKPHLILLDYSLPDITGGEVARRLLEDEETASIPIIMMSGHVAEMRNVAATCANVVATIEKPFLSSALVELVERTLADLPALTAPARKKKVANAPAPTASAPPVVAPKKKSRNGKHSPPKSEPQAVTPPIEAAPEEPAPEPAPEATPAEIPSAPEATEASALPAAVRGAKLNSVVLGLPLEVISLELSPHLRIRKIRARPISNLVSLHVLPQGKAELPFSDAMFELARVDLDADSQINLVLLAPSPASPPKPEGYPTAIDGVIISPADYGDAVHLTPTAIAPLRMQHLALFELSSVELSANFRVAHLILKSRGGKTRVTLFPDLAQRGATFDTADVRLNSHAQIDEILLSAAEQ